MSKAYRARARTIGRPKRLLTGSRPRPSAARRRLAGRDPRARVRPRRGDGRLLRRVRRLRRARARRERAARRRRCRRSRGRGPTGRLGREVDRLGRSRWPLAALPLVVVALVAPGPIGRRAHRVAAGGGARTRRGRLLPWLVPGGAAAALRRRSPRARSAALDDYGTAALGLRRSGAVAGLVVILARVGEDGVVAVRLGRSR